MYLWAQGTARASLHYTTCTTLKRHSLVTFSSTILMVAFLMYHTDQLEDLAPFFDFSASDHDSSNPPGSSDSHGRALRLIDIAESQASPSIFGKEHPEKELYLSKSSRPAVARPTFNAIVNLDQHWNVYHHHRFSIQRILPP